jgi:hypothetical protein
VIRQNAPVNAVEVDPEEHGSFAMRVKYTLAACADCIALVVNGRLHERRRRWTRRSHGASALTGIIW